MIFAHRADFQAVQPLLDETAKCRVHAASGMTPEHECEQEGRLAYLDHVNIAACPYRAGSEIIAIVEGWLVRGDGQ